MADKYEVESLLGECSRILTEKLSIASVSTVLKLADMHNDVHLKETAKIFFRSNFVRVVETINWAQIVDDNPKLASEVLGSIKFLPGAK